MPPVQFPERHHRNEMNKLIVLFCVCALAAAIPAPDGPSALEIEQNKNARYDFQTKIVDHINDLTQDREEVRDGTNVKGSYSYSDGYVKRTVHYVADEGGFRITGEETVPLEGPKVDEHGTASVLNRAHGTELEYSVKSVPAEHGKQILS